MQSTVYETSVPHNGFSLNTELYLNTWHVVLFRNDFIALSSRSYMYCLDHECLVFAFEVIELVSPSVSYFSGWWVSADGGGSVNTRTDSQHMLKHILLSKQGEDNFMSSTPDM